MKASSRVFAAALLLANASCVSAQLPANRSSYFAAHTAASKGTASRKPIPCAQVGALRDLGRRTVVVTNRRTGNTLEYLVIGDAAVSDDLLIFFPGTGQVLPGWPVQMLTNSKYSPKIVHTIGYRASEDGPISLCHNYRLLLFDYPGVGRSPLIGDVTRDMIASDVDAAATDAETTYGISADRVDPVGWSLGTTNALKYAFLSPVSRPAREIHNVILVAGHGGGSLQGVPNADAAACVSKLFKASLLHPPSLLYPTNQFDASKFDREIAITLGKLIFPYQGQGPDENGTHSGCTVTFKHKTVDLSVQLDCSDLNGCRPYLINTVLQIFTYPWRLTKGIDHDVYVQQQELSNDWNVAYCARAGPNFTSEDCSRYGRVKMSVTNGGICKTDMHDLNHPFASDCARIKMTGKLTVINGYEDLFIQWTYGKALVDGYARAWGRNSARLVTSPAPAGHGVMIQHPEWTQLQIAEAMSNR